MTKCKRRRNKYGEEHARNEAYRKRKSEESMEEAKSRVIQNRVTRDRSNVVTLVNGRWLNRKETIKVANKMSK